MRPEDLARPSPLDVSSGMGKRIIQSHEWIAQEKVDGWRALWDGKRLWSRHGLPIGAALDRPLPARTTIDGEYKAGHYYAFDLLMVDGDDITGLPLRERLELLQELPVEGVTTV